MNRYNSNNSSINDGSSARSRNKNDYKELSFGADS